VHNHHTKFHVSSIWVATSSYRLPRASPYSLCHRHITTRKHQKMPTTCQLLVLQRHHFLLPHVMSVPSHIILSYCHVSHPYHVLCHPIMCQHPYGATCHFHIVPCVTFVLVQLSLKTPNLTNTCQLLVFALHPVDVIVTS
jgi:hypothetical protein